MKRYMMLALLVQLTSAYADNLSWPIQCADGSKDTCLLHVGYPDIDGIDRAYNCDKPIYKGHTGTDLIPKPSAIKEGVSVLAATDGTVIFASDSYYDQCPAEHPQCEPAPRSSIRPGFSSGYTWCTKQGEYCPKNEDARCFWCFSGNVVVLKHDSIDGVYATAYLHLRKNSVPVKSGDMVKRGELIGQVGSSGRSDQPHLHFEVWQDGLYKPVDPWSGECSTGAGLWHSQR